MTALPAVRPTSETSPLRRLLSRWPKDPRALAMRRLFPTQVAVLPRSRPVALQLVEDPFYFGLFAALYEKLNGFTGAPADLVVFRSISGAVGMGWRAALRRSGLFSAIVSARWLRLSAGLFNRVAYRSQSFRHPLGDLIDAGRAYLAWRRAATAVGGDFILAINGIEVGDLVVDSYLRFRPSPRFDARSLFVLHLVWQAHRDVRRARRYFGRKGPSVFLTSYSTYLEHGIPVRVALAEGIRVISFGSFARFGKELTIHDVRHTTSGKGYRLAFETLEEPQELLARAEAALTGRLRGGIDTATSYMRASAYSASGKKVPDGIRGSVVVFLHDFYDSPHVYDRLVFQDFWSWICCTIETLQSSGRQFFLKPHPNQISLSSEVIQELRSRYPGIRLLEAGVTTVQLVEAGMVCGVTVYGTIAHELAYLGVPSIGCAAHPHQDFDFCRTAGSVTEYQELLQRPEVLPVSKVEMKRQALVFYAMHNLSGSDEQLDMRRHFVGLWKACHDPAIAPSDLAAQMAAWRDSAVFASFARRLAEGQELPS